MFCSCQINLKRINLKNQASNWTILNGQLINLQSIGVITMAIQGIEFVNAHYGNIRQLTWKKFAY